MKVLDVIFPKTCALCKGELSQPEAALCDRCQKELPVMKHVCAIENLTIDGTNKLSVYCALRYTGTVKTGIISMKYGDRPQVCEFLGETMYRVLSESRECDLNFSDFDVVVPVPSTPEKIKMRGYNQAELIADRFAVLAGLPIETASLKKNTNVVSQSTLDMAARQKSVAGIYEVADASMLNGKKVLLVDDILTTGATAIECAKILYRAGAAKVVCLTASTGKKDV